MLSEFGEVRGISLDDPRTLIPVYTEHPTLHEYLILQTLGNDPHALHGGSVCGKKRKVSDGWRVARPRRPRRRVGVAALQPLPMAASAPSTLREAASSRRPGTTPVAPCRARHAPRRTARLGA